MVVGNWGYMVFLATADCELLSFLAQSHFVNMHLVVMILRVAALWNQSRTILAILFLIYVSQVVVNIVWDSVYENPGTSLSGII